MKGLVGLAALVVVITVTSREAEAIASCDASDSGALLEFASAFNDYGKVLVSWQPGTDCCSWRWVNCSAITGRVQGLEIVGPELKTGLPLIRKVDFGGPSSSSDSSSLPTSFSLTFHQLFQTTPLIF